MPSPTRKQRSYVYFPENELSTCNSCSWHRYVVMTDPDGKKDLTHNLLMNNLI